MATTSKEGSRRVNYSVPKGRGSDDKYCTMGETLMQQRRVKDDGFRIVNFFS